MSLSCKGNGRGSREIAKGVYLDSAKIIDVGILNGLVPDGWESAIVLGIELTLEKPGLDFNPRIRLFGTPKFENGVPTGWGSAFSVRDALTSVAGFDGNIGDDLKIPDAVLLAMIGKEVFYVRYVYGKNEDKVKYATFNQVDISEQGIIKKWVRSREKGYPKNYNPAVLQQDTPSNNTPPVGEEF